MRSSEWRMLWATPSDLYGKGRKLFWSYIRERARISVSKLTLRSCSTRAKQLQFAKRPTSSKSAGSRSYFYLVYDHHKRLESILLLRKFRNILLQASTRYWLRDGRHYSWTSRPSQVTAMDKFSLPPTHLGPYWMDSNLSDSWVYRFRYLCTFWRVVEVGLLSCSMMAAARKLSPAVTWSSTSRW
jgi:hypothetical protein